MATGLAGAATGWADEATHLSSGGDERLKIGRIAFAVTDIYSPEEVAATNGMLRFIRNGMNSIHMTTRQYVLRSELLFQPGDVLDLDILAETERNLRDLGYLRNIEIVPIDTLADGTVDLEVRAQETWSLSTDFSYSRSSEGTQRWNVFLSDDNFFGHGLQVGAGVGENEDYHFVQFQFRKRRIFGTNWQLAFSKAEQGDGYADAISLRRPFYAQDDRWRYESSVWRTLSDRRYYFSNAGPAGSDPSRTTSLYARVPLKNEGLNFAAIRRLSPTGHGRIWRLGLGLEIRYLSFDFDKPGILLSDGRATDFGFLSRRDSPLSREDGSTVYPHLILNSEGRQWVTTQYMLKYGPIEDVPLNPSFEVRLGATGPGLGSTANDGERLLLDYRFRDWSRWGESFFLLEGSGFASLGGAAERAAAATLLAGWLGRHDGLGEMRLTRLFAEAGWGDRLLGTDAFVLGLNRGLRSLDFDGMSGDRLVRWNGEHGLVLPFELLGFYRVGVAAFYSGGMAWWRGEDRGFEDVRHEIGFGLRLGSTRSARADVTRLDLTWALGEGGGPELTAVTRGQF